MNVEQFKKTIIVLSIIFGVGSLQTIVGLWPSAETNEMSRETIPEITIAIFKNFLFLLCLIHILKTKSSNDKSKNNGSKFNEKEKSQCRLRNQNTALKVNLLQTITASSVAIKSIASSMFSFFPDMNTLDNNRNTEAYRKMYPMMP